MSEYSLFDVKKNKSIGNFHSRTDAMEHIKKLCGNVVWTGVSYVGETSDSEYRIIPIPTVSTESFFRSPPQKSNR